MRLNRFFTERKNLRIGSSVKLPDSDISQIKKVLRLTKGDKVIVFNGEKEYLATLTLVSKDVVLVKLNELLNEISNQEDGVSFTLFQGLLRAGKFDTIIEKTTELGINKIVPVECDFSQSKVEVVDRKISRWSKLAVSAAKQSERIDVPTIADGVEFKNLKEILKQYDKVYFFTIPRKKIEESLESKDLIEVKANIKSKKIAFIVGPEGGFSPREHEMAKKWKLKFVHYNAPVLRAETAAVVLTGILKFIYSK
jgi:16S rRNA (uracil1498-N3)-methyltransferase